ncbi:MAG: histidine phosphatase family protein [Clostridia bacterium]|nr:histidine phosphatase family protein [Clostridia bacterium]
MENTTVYLIRHSTRFDLLDLIDKYNTTQGKTIKREKIILSVTGEKRAELLSNEPELQNIDVVYASNCVRTLETAKYMVEKQNLKVNIDERFDERRLGSDNSKKYPNWFELELTDENFKTEGGESQVDVRARFIPAFDEAVRDNKGKRIAIFSHGIAIAYFLLRWCKVERVDADKRFCLSFNGKVFFDKIYNSPEVFKIILNEHGEPKSIELITFDDIEQMNA